MPAPQHPAPSGVTAPDRAPARVVVLCDAAAATGLGHYVRCSSLAGVLARRGASVHVLLPEDSLPSAVDRSRAAGWEVHLGPWSTGAVCRVADPGAVVVVDSYRVDGPWLARLHEALRKVGAALAVVDDAADRTFTADLVLNQNIGADGLDYPGAGTVLAGPRYALLRPEFPAARAAGIRSLHDLPDAPRRVLVVFGGTDATGMALIGARAARSAFPQAEVRVIAPGSTPAPMASADITVLEHVESIHEEMLGAELVLSAGGTTVWELCCLGRPTAVVAVADNQRPAYDLLVAAGAVLPAGRTVLYDAEALARRLRELTAEPGSLRRVAEVASRLTDGRGSERVASELCRIVPSSRRTTPSA